MKIIVLNGSPKGDVSITMQYVHFVQKNSRSMNWKYWHLAANQGQSKNRISLSEIIDEVRSATGFMGFPLYFLLVPSNYNDSSSSSGREGEDAFKNKYAGISEHLDPFLYILPTITLMRLAMTSIWSSPGGSPLRCMTCWRKGKKAAVAVSPNISLTPSKTNIPMSRNFSSVDSQFDRLYSRRCSEQDQRWQAKSGGSDGLEGWGDLIWGGCFRQFTGVFSGEVEVIDLNELNQGRMPKAAFSADTITAAYTVIRSGYVEFFNTTVKRAPNILRFGRIDQRQVFVVTMEAVLW